MLDRDRVTVRETARLHGHDSGRTRACATLRESLDTDEIVGYVRSPSDVLRLLIYGIGRDRPAAGDPIRTGCGARVRAATSSARSASSNRPPTRVLDGVAQLLWVVAVLGVIVFPFALRRYRLLGYLIVANIVASSLVNAAIEFVDQEEPKRIANDAGRACRRARRQHHHRHRASPP